MAVKPNTLKTRIQSKFDHISAWNANGSFIPLAGELVIAYVPKTPETFQPEEGGHGVKAPPKQFLMKVGDGQTAISALEWVTAKAGDVWNWAKKQYLEWDDLNEDFLNELSTYIHNNSKNTVYSLSNDGSANVSAHVNLMASDENGISSVGTILLPDVLKLTNDHLETDENGTVSLPVEINRVVGNNELLNISSFVLSDSIQLSAMDPSSEQFVKSYALMRNGKKCGNTTIDIPKDFIVKDASVRTIQQYLSTESYDLNDLIINYPTDYGIYRASVDIVGPTTWETIISSLVLTEIQSRTEYEISAGQKVIDFIINTISNDVPGEEHIYIPVKDLLGDELDATVSAQALSTDPNDDFFNVISGVTIREEDGVLDSVSVDNVKLNKIALSGNAKYLTQDENDFLILNCGSATVLTSNAFRTYMEFDDGTSQWFNFSGEISQQTMADVGLFNLDNYVWIKNPTNVKIGSKVASIGDGTFNSCIGLTSITIPNSVTSIGEYAFNSCIGLTSITIPNSVTSIGNYAFNYCTGLTSITIPNSVTSIGEYAFSDCSELTSVTIPNSVTSIGNYAFNYCTGLISIEIPNSVTSIGDSAFSDCSGLASVAIPNSVTSIGEWAFSYCTELTFITIPNSVTSIGNGAFSGSGLISIEIPNSVTSIGNNTFYGCSGLTSITILNSVTSIGNYAFGGCPELTSVTIEGKSQATVQGMDNYSWGLNSGCTISGTDPNTGESWQIVIE